jgi:hypothetical protein
VLAALSAGHSYEKAADAAKIGRTALFAWKKADAKFNDECLAAEEAGTDRLEDEATRRAVKGTLRPVFYKGEQVGSIREYSDTLLIFLLKARRPDKFKESVAHEHGGKDGRPIVVELVNF